MFFGGLQSFIGSTITRIETAPSVSSSLRPPLDEETSGSAAGSLGGVRRSAAQQPSQSQSEHEAPHWPLLEPHAQLQHCFGGGGGDGSGAQPSQSHDSHATPH